MTSETAPDIVARIDALLPQTQCTRCGYAGCKPYAAAIAGGEAEINQCPPGGSAAIAALAKLLGRPVQALNPVHGIESPPRVAWVDESRCIGCARCLAPCPVDAIVETRIHEYHMEHRGENIMTKDKLLAVGERYEAMIAADKAADARFR